jgi:hypothetical protein
MSGFRDLPDASDFPHADGIPDIPDIPSTPDIPSIPGIPSVDARPSAPSRGAGTNAAASAGKERGREMPGLVIPKSELKAALGYRDLILASAAKYKLDPAIVAGIGSRESGWGTGSDMQPKGPGGTGDRAERPPKPPLRGKLPPDGLGFGRGLMQADWDWSDFARNGAWANPAANIDFGCNEFADDIQAFLKQGFTSADAERAAISAYNHGVAGVLADIRHGGMGAVDAGTAHHNYSADVLARAAFYRQQAFGSGAPAALNYVLDDAAPAAVADVLAAAPSPWPKEGSPTLDVFFGPIEVDADGALQTGWEDAHLTNVICPWPLTLAWDQSKRTSSIRCNKKVADSLHQILGAIWDAYDRDYSAISRARMHLYGGCFEFRRKRGLSGLSMHAYGAAVDFDPDGNPMYLPGQPVDIHMPSPVVDIFKAAGWKWGNDFSGRKDPMHFQATS